jgi:hypothetical protein
MKSFANDYGLIHINVIFAVIILSISLFVIAEVISVQSTSVQSPAFPIFLSIVLFLFSIILIMVSPKDIDNYGTDKQKAMLKQCQAESKSNNYDNLSQLMIDCQKRHEKLKM